MEPSLGLQVRCMRQLRRVKATEVVVLAPGLYLRQPAVCPTAKRHAKETAGVVGLGFAHVLRIDAISRKPQIRDAVVVLFAVDVIDLLRGPLAVHIEPCEPMRQIERPVDSDRQVATFGNAARNLSRLDTTWARRL